MHAVVDYDIDLPNYTVITDGKTHVFKLARQHIFPLGSMLVVDRAYIDFELLYNLDSNDVIYITRLKSNTDFEIEEELSINEKHDHILSDQLIKLAGSETMKKHPEVIRIVEVYDEKNDQILIFMTNQLTWTADTISQLYKARWDMEVVFYAKLYINSSNG